MGEVLKAVGVSFEVMSEVTEITPKVTELLSDGFVDFFAVGFLLFGKREVSTTGSLTIGSRFCSLFNEGFVQDVEVEFGSFAGFVQKLEVGGIGDVDVESLSAVVAARDREVSGF